MSISHTCSITIRVIVKRPDSLGRCRTVMKSPIHRSARSVFPSAPAILKIASRIFWYLICNIFQILLRYLNLRSFKKSLYRNAERYCRFTEIESFARILGKDANFRFYLPHSAASSSPLGQSFVKSHTRLLSKQEPLSHQNISSVHTTSDSKHIC